MKTFRERVLTKIAVGEEGQCWPWVGAYKSYGYGYLRIGDSKGGKKEGVWKDIPAHRAAYMVFHGDIPADMFVLHSCDNRGCCNPAHLRLGTLQENSRDMVFRRRGNMIPKLNEDQIREIRKKRSEGKEVHELAEEYGVAKSTIYGVVACYRWKTI